MYIQRQLTLLRMIYNTLIGIRENKFDIAIAMKNPS